MVLFKRSLSATAAELRPPPPPSLASSIDDDEAMDLCPTFRAVILAGCWNAEATDARRSWSKSVNIAEQDIFMFCDVNFVIRLLDTTTTLANNSLSRLE